MKKIDEHIESIKNTLNDSQISKQQRRYLEQELEELEKFRENNPDAENVPNSLELFCDSNPDALECRIYDD